jgi:hypothetical protein
MFKKIFNRFIKMDQNEKLIKNLEAYEQTQRKEKSQSGNFKRNKLHGQKNEKV